MSRNDIFEELEPSQLKAVLDKGKREFFCSGNLIFLQGAPADRYYFVLSGRVKLTVLHKEGKELLLRYTDKGDIASAVALFGERQYSLTAKAVLDTVAMSWNREFFLDILKQYPVISMNLLKTKINHLDELQARCLEMVAEQAEQRIARALLRIMKHSGVKTNNGIEISFSLSRHEIASYTGNTLFTVSRVLSSWAKKGWIKSGREKVIIVKPHELMKFSEGIS